MIEMYAPDHLARRVLIAVLAFALAVGFAFVAMTGEADAAPDIKNYQATVTPTTVNAGAVVDSFSVTFKNLGPTNTQRAGAFSIDFSDFSNVSIVGGPTADGGLSWTGSVSGGVVTIRSVDGGNRIYVDDEVTVNVKATAPGPGEYTLTTAADQEWSGDFKGGSAFDPPIGGDPTVTVVSVETSCTGGDCDLTGNGWNASLTCDEPCSYLVNPNGGFVADVTVNSDGTVYMILTTTDKGPAPGSAFVEADGVLLPNCGTNGPPKCVHIQRVSGNHTQYEVFWSGDPRFKFG